jgi:hypothetical protein
VKRKLLFFGVLVLFLYNLISCKKNEPVKEIDPETGTFKFSGIVIDSTDFPDTSKGPWGAPNTATILKITNRDVSGTIRFNKNSDSIILLSRPKRDSLAYYSGTLFSTYPNDSLYSYWACIGNCPDTVIFAKYSNNAFIIPSQSGTLTCIDGNIDTYDGVGKFTNGKWELTYKTRGKIGSYLFANHTYHLICTK